MYPTRLSAAQAWTHKLTNHQIWVIDCEDDDQDFLDGRLQSLRDAQAFSPPRHLFTRPIVSPLLNSPTFSPHGHPTSLASFLASSFAMSIPVTPTTYPSVPREKGRLVGSLPASSIGRARTLLPSKRRNRVFSLSSSRSRSPSRPNSETHDHRSNHTFSIPRPQTPPFPLCMEDCDHSEPKRVKNGQQNSDESSSACITIKGLKIYTEDFEDDTSDIEPSGDPPFFGSLPDCPVLCLCNCTTVWVVSAGLQPGLYFNSYVSLSFVCCLAFAFCHV